VAGDHQRLAIGAERTDCSEPIVPLAPALLSTMTATPQR
jgi:hypothetical protein